ncbi:hypothetical protein PG987_007278 [Apiospora arundinis]
MWLVVSTSEFITKTSHGGQEWMERWRERRDGLAEVTTRSEAFPSATPPALAASTTVPGCRWYARQ